MTIISTAWKVNVMNCPHLDSLNKNLYLIKIIEIFKCDLQQIRLEPVENSQCWKRQSCVKKMNSENQNKSKRKFRFVNSSSKVNNFSLSWLSALLFYDSPNPSPSPVSPSGLAWRPSWRRTPSGDRQWGRWHLKISPACRNSKVCKWRFSFWNPSSSLSCSLVIFSLFSCSVESDFWVEPDGKSWKS